MKTRRTAAAAALLAAVAATACSAPATGGADAQVSAATAEHGDGAAPADPPDADRPAVVRTQEEPVSRTPDAPPTPTPPFTEDLRSRPMPPPRDGNVAIQEELDAARRAGTAEAYDLFIARHPDHALIPAARAERARLGRP